MKLNKPTIKKPVFTHEGGPASRISSLQELERTVMSCMLWEDVFYENGQDIASRISGLISKIDANKVADVAIRAREQGKLRHVPLLIVREMARLNSHKHLVAETLERVIQRPDELTEFLAIYFKDKRQPLSNQVKKGLAAAFQKFNSYSLAKYNFDRAIKLKDVLFLCHAKPKDAEQEKLWKDLINDKLESPDTWEVALSKGGDKKSNWEDLLSNNKLGALALLRNLRNFSEAGVNENLIKLALSKCNPEKVLPFRFISAAKFAPKLEPELESLMFKSLESHSKIRGKTVLLIDVSGSMNYPISSKSEMSRIDAACALAILAREICEDVAIYTFSSKATLVPNRRGFALRDAIMRGFGGSTRLRACMESINQNEKYDSMIVFTDEQSEDGVGNFNGNGFICNVATNKNGVAYDKAVHINGFSESSLQFISNYLGL